MIVTRILTLLFVIAVFLSPSADAKTCAKGQKVRPSGPSNVQIEKTLKVRGQTRTLNMMLVLKNKKDKLKFINARTKYREEILNTEY